MSPLSFQPGYAEKPSKHQTYNASDKGKARRHTYRHDRSKWQTDATYLARPFIMWDGEGVTLADGSHIYVMFGHSEGGYIADPHGLSSARILDYVISERAKYPDAIHCIYGGSYDFNMWLSNASQSVVRGIYERDYSRFGPYLIQWRRGKSFFVKYWNLPDKGSTVYDVVSFFQCSFVKACDSYLGDAFTDREMIVKNKAARGSFIVEDMPTMHRYMMSELDNGVRLMNELRSRLNAVNLRPKRWDGPGAIAAALLAREGVKEALCACPEPVAEAGRYAYFGGRFEVIKYGAVQHAAYEYDVNSAYPYALQFVPNLRSGTWVYEDSPAWPVGPNADKEFTVWHVSFKGGDYRLPQPLPWRAFKGNVVYPGDGEFSGWYWTPDVVAAVEYARRDPRVKLTITSCWRFVEDNPLDRPFHFIAELYKERQALKARGDGAHVGIKLALNSLYGKLAQQVGAREYAEGWRLPPFHQLEFAGFTTSMCRSMVYQAALTDVAPHFGLDKVIAYETDALFTTEPLALPLGPGLGDWEETCFRDLTYVQSGVYFGTLSDGTTFAKTRGVNLNTLTRENVETAMQQADAQERHATAELTQFITAGLALRGRWRQWRRWITSEKRLEVEPQGKRVPLGGHAFGDWGLTFAARVPDGAHSAAFPIMWVNPNAGMEELEELRNMGNAEFYDLMDGYGE